MPPPAAVARRQHAEGAMGSHWWLTTFRRRSRVMCRETAQTYAVVASLYKATSDNEVQGLPLRFKDATPPLECLC